MRWSYDLDRMKMGYEIQTILLDFLEAVIPELSFGGGEDEETGTR